VAGDLPAVGVQSERRPNFEAIVRIGKDDDALIDAERVGPLFPGELKGHGFTSPTTRRRRKLKMQAPP